MHRHAWRRYGGVFGGLLALVFVLAAASMLASGQWPGASTGDADRGGKANPAFSASSLASSGELTLRAELANGGGEQAGIVRAGFMRGPSGALLPRFATLARGGVQVRLGPGTQYPLAWTIRTAGMPLEILAEADGWLRIRDHEGEEGWVSVRDIDDARRAALVAPWRHGARLALRGQAMESAPLRAWLGSGVLVQVLRCDGRWCLIRAGEVDGWLEQAQLWGVYHDERFNGGSG